MVVVIVTELVTVSISRLHVHLDFRYRITIFDCFAAHLIVGTGPTFVD